MVLASPVTLNDHRFVGETRSARPYALTIHDPLATEGTKTVSKHRRSNIEIRLRDDRFHYRFRSHVTSLFSFLFSRRDNVLQQNRKCNEIERKGEKKLWQLVNAKYKTVIVGERAIVLTSRRSKRVRSRISGRRSDRR